MEGIVSILIFTVLIAAITTMMLLSLRFSDDAIRNSTLMQTEVNALLEFSEIPAAQNITLTYTGGNASNPITPPPLVGVNIYTSAVRGFVVFEPQ